MGYRNKSSLFAIPVVNLQNITYALSSEGSVVLRVYFILESKTNRLTSTLCQENRNTLSL